MNEEMSLLEFIDESPSPYHAVENIIKILEKKIIINWNGVPLGYWRKTKITISLLMTVH